MKSHLLCVIISVYRNICLIRFARQKHVRLTFGKYLVQISARVMYPDQNLPQSIQNDAYVHQNKSLYLTSLSIHEHPSFSFSFGATLAINTFTTSLSVANLNVQPNVFKCQGSFNAFIDQQNLGTLLINYDRQESAYIAVWPKSDMVILCGTLIWPPVTYGSECIDITLWNNKVNHSYSCSSLFVIWTTCNQL